MNRNRFQLHITRPNGAPGPAEISVTGEVDAGSAEQFLQAIRELPGPQPFIVNLSSAFYFDSAGFAALDRLLADNAILLVIEPDSPLFKAAELMCMSRYLSVTDARQSLQ